MAASSLSSSPTASPLIGGAHVSVYVVQYSACEDEVEAADLDEACTIADCLLPDGQEVVSVSGPDGTRVMRD